MADMWGRRAILQMAALAASAAFGSVTPSAQPRPSRRFIIDSHLHFDARPDFFDTLVSTYRPRNAMPHH